MLHFWSLDHVDIHGSLLAIGSFDGIHLGHQAILKNIVRESRSEGLPAVVLTFHPHPGIHLGKRQGAFYLTPPEEKLRILADLGIDALIFHPFNLTVASLSAREFIDRLSNHLKFKLLCVGSDFSLGRNREGNLKVLEQLGREYHYQVKTVSPIELEGRIISSSWVREALSQGDMGMVKRLLGRPYRIRGEVVHGDGRGKTLGFPTANIRVWSERAIPAPGVYVGWAEVEGTAIPAVTNVGYRPTFENQSSIQHVEAHLLDFDQDLYHRQINLSFLVRLRAEQKFAHIQDLIDQVQDDIEQARLYLEATGYETVPGSAPAST